MYKGRYSLQRVIFNGGIDEMSGFCVFILLIYNILCGGLLPGRKRGRERLLWGTCKMMTYCAVVEWELTDGGGVCPASPGKRMRRLRRAGFSLRYLRLAVAGGAEGRCLRSGLVFVIRNSGSPVGVAAVFLVVQARIIAGVGRCTSRRNRFRARSRTYRICIGRLPICIR